MGNNHGIKVVTHILVSTPPPPEAIQLCLPSHFSVAQGWGFLAGEGRVLWSVLSILSPLLAGVRCWCLLFFLLCSRVHFGLFFHMFVNTLLQLSVSLQVCGFMIHLNLPCMVHFA